jgi:hypothetical protein
MNSTIDQVRQAAKIAILDPRLAKKLQRFFTRCSSHQDNRDIKAWTDVSDTHWRLFELLVESRDNGDFEPCMKLVLRIARQNTNPIYRSGPTILKSVLLGTTAFLFIYIVFLFFR